MKTAKLRPVKPQYEYRIIYSYTNRPCPPNEPFEAEVGGLKDSETFLKRLARTPNFDKGHIEQREIGEWSKVKPASGK